MVISEYAIFTVLFKYYVCKFLSLVFIYWQCYCFITKPMDDDDENVLYAGIYMTQKCGTKCVTVSPSPLATPLTTAPALQGK